MGGLAKLALIRSLDRDLAIMRYNHFENAFKGAEAVML
jgi:hypothetical protein